jgi:hypothetical protein
MLHRPSSRADADTLQTLSDARATSVRPSAARASRTMPNDSFDVTGSNNRWAGTKIATSRPADAAGSNLRKRSTEAETGAARRLTSLAAVQETADAKTLAAENHARPRMTEVRNSLISAPS